jgi:hypothetical protein
MGDENSMRAKNSTENLKGKEHLGNRDVNMRAILKQIVKEDIMKVCTK